MTDGVDDWVEAWSHLGKETWQLRDEWCDGRFGTHACQEDDERVGAPDAGPQQDVGHGNFGNLELGVLGFVILLEEISSQIGNWIVVN